MPHLDEQHRQRQMDNKTPTQTTNLSKTETQHPSSSALTTESQRQLPHHPPSNPPFQPGKIQFRELLYRPLHHWQLSQSFHNLTPINGTSNTPWVKLTTEGVRSIVAEFTPLNRGFSKPLLNPFVVERHSGILDQGPGQMIEFSDGRPSVGAGGRGRGCVSAFVFYVYERGLELILWTFRCFASMWIGVIWRCMCCCRRISWSVRDVGFCHMRSRLRI